MLFKINWKVVFLTIFLIAFAELIGMKPVNAQQTEPCIVEMTPLSWNPKQLQLIAPAECFSESSQTTVVAFPYTIPGAGLSAEGLVLNPQWIQLGNDKVTVVSFPYVSGHAFTTITSQDGTILEVVGGLNLVPPWDFVEIITEPIFIEYEDGNSFNFHTQTILPEESYSVIIGCEEENCESIVPIWTQYNGEWTTEYVFQEIDPDRIAVFTLSKEGDNTLVGTGSVTGPFLDLHKIFLPIVIR